jgi:hypothetical protein
VLVGRRRLQSAVVEGAAHREVIQDLERVTRECERSMGEVVKKQPMPLARMPDASASRYSCCGNRLLERRRWLPERSISGNDTDWVERAGPALSACLRTGAATR